MTEFQSTNPVRDGNGASHRSLAELEAGLRALPAAPKESGWLRLIVCRHSPGVHEALERVRLSVEEGVPGDEWNRRLPRHPDAQLTVISHAVAGLITNGQLLTVSGDNLVVELDISAANLPVGTRLRVGEAIVEMTPKPHNGCAKFEARFGAGALRFVQAPTTRHRNLRGVYWKVVEPGMVEVDAPIWVISRPTTVNDIEEARA